MVNIYRLLSDHVPFISESLHWLPLVHFIKFKLLVLQGPSQLVSYRIITCSSALLTMAVLSICLSVSLTILFVPSYSPLSYEWHTQPSLIHEANSLFSFNVSSRLSDSIQTPIRNLPSSNDTVEGLLGVCLL